MALANSNTNFNERLSATIAAWMSHNYKSFFIQNHPLFTKLKERGQIITAGFGTSMVEPMRFPSASGPTIRAIADSDTAYAAVTQAATTGFSAATYTAAEYYIPISIEEYFLHEQGSDTAKVNFAQGVMEQSMDRLMFAIMSDFWAVESTSTSAGGRGALGSIRTFMNASDTASTTSAVNPTALTEQIGKRAVEATGGAAVTLVGGIQRAAAEAAYWCTPIINTATVIGVQGLSQLISLASCRNEKPDMIVIHRDLFDKLMSIASLAGTNGGQVFSESKLANIGFEAIKFRGADLVVDDNCPTTVKLTGTAGTTYGYNAFAINSKYLKIRTKSMKPAVRPVDDARPIKVWAGQWYGQLTSSNLGRVHARHVNLTLS